MYIVECSHVRRIFPLMIFLCLLSCIKVADSSSLSSSHTSIGVDSFLLQFDFFPVYETFWKTVKQSQKTWMKICTLDCSWWSQSSIVWLNIQNTTLHNSLDQIAQFPHLFRTQGYHSVFVFCVQYYNCHYLVWNRTTPIPMWKKTLTIRIVCNMLEDPSCIFLFYFVFSINFFRFAFF